MISPASSPPWPFQKTIDTMWTQDPTVCPKRINAPSVKHRGKSQYAPAAALHTTAVPPIRNSAGPSTNGYAKPFVLAWGMSLSSWRTSNATLKPRGGGYEAYFRSCPPAAESFLQCKCILAIKNIKMGTLAGTLEGLRHFLEIDRLSVGANAREVRRKTSDYIPGLLLRLGWDQE